MGKFVLQFKENIKEDEWLLGICLHGFDDLKNNQIHWISNGKYQGKKWFADPFILDFNEKEIHLLVEEFDYSLHRGRIAHLVVDRVKWEVIDCIIILDLTTHLSFPAIYRKGDKVYVCPENHQSGEHDLYEYDRKAEKLIKLKALCLEELTDTTLHKFQGKWYMFTTSIPHPNGDTLEIKVAEKIEGPYEQTQLVKFSEHIGRNAGQLFMYNDKLIRPAQESYDVYGHAIVFQQVSIDDNGEFHFEEIYRYHSTHPKYNIGAHTFNVYKEMAVIDVKGYRHNLLGRFWNNMIKLAVKVGLKSPIIFD